ncbi:hypothetical protein PGB90_002299 [Kerria lacca]
MNNTRISGYRTYNSKWNKTTISLQKPITKLIVIYKPEDVIAAVEEIYQRCKKFPVIGMDCEWTPVHRKKEKPDVALLQIATNDGFCILLRTCFMTELPHAMLELLSDPCILKVGVGIFNDGEFLKHKYPELNIKGRFDIRYFSRFCNVFSKNESLKELTKALLPFELQKENILQYKWDDYLDNEMVQYAALDALAGVLIFEKLLPLFHEQESEVPFHTISSSELIERYFFNRNSICNPFVDTKL